MTKKTSDDVLHVVISDTHTGSNHALFLDREWHGVKTSHIPRSNQKKIREQFIKYCDAVAQAREGKKIRLIHTGDAIDGDHHHSGDVCTQYEDEQADIHIELMLEMQKRIGWRRGDELYYVKGTEIHVNEMENIIARELNAVPCGDFGAWDVLTLETNGVKSLFVHHGKGAGTGANEGNSVRNWMRDIYYDHQKIGKRHPDIIYTGHVHNPTYNCWVYRKGFEFAAIHGIILPSWQMKNRYAWMKAPVSVNWIGGVIHEIKADGMITIPKFYVMDSD